MWSFNRLRDADKIEKEEVIWQGPFSWPDYENVSNLPKLPDIEGIYLLTFQSKDSFILYSAGITQTTKKRFLKHYFEYLQGYYNVFDVEAAQKGERNVIWLGWNYAKKNREEFYLDQDAIQEAVYKQFGAFRIFIAEVKISRKRERIKAAIMQNVYASKEPWADLADRGMFLKIRYNNEMPIELRNIMPVRIFGLPEFLEV